jgi:hypothetical protein
LNFAAFNFSPASKIMSKPEPAQSVPDWLAPHQSSCHQSHIRVAFQNQNFIQVGIFWRHFFGGIISIATKPLCRNGFVPFAEKSAAWHRSCKRELRPAAFLFASERHDNSDERQNHNNQSGAGAAARAAMVAGGTGGTRRHFARGGQRHRGRTALAVRRHGARTGGGV